MKDPPEFDLSNLALKREAIAKEKAFLQAEFHQNQVYNEEQARHYELRILLLENERADIKAEFFRNHEEMLETQNDLELTVDSLAGDLKTERLNLQAKIRENELQKAELESLKTVNNDSARNLTEKLSLAREVASLKPELEHLRSQVASHKSLLSEKLGLERQLKTVQVELETEKRCTERLQGKENTLQSECAKLASELRSLKSDLAEIKQQHQTDDREAQKTIAEWETKGTTMESRIDGFRSKLRITREQLKAAQTDLRNAQQTTIVGIERSAATGVGKEKGITSYKRTSQQLDADSVIGTPGVLPTRKNNDRAHTLPGDKSTFSITPYLNRATSVTLDDAAQTIDVSENEDEISASYEPPDNNGHLKKPAVTGLPKTKGLLPDNTTADSAKLGIAKSNQRGKTSSRAPPKRNFKVAPSLEKVTERDEDGEDAIGEAVKASKGKVMGTSDNVLNENLDGRRKKRKLLGGDTSKTLFGEDEDEVVKGGAQGKPALGAAKSRSRIGLAPSKGSFGAISPLKKEKRAAADQL